RRQEPLIALDYDSAELCLRSADVRELLQVRQELWAVCDYACLRKESSKAGSVLILRFFRGYYPTEIACILGSPPRLANDWLRIARIEARAYLENPSALRFVSAPRHSSAPANGHPAADSCKSKDGESDTADILRHLRERIQRS